MYAYQLRGQMLTLWVYDPNSPGNDNVTMVLDLSRTDQNLINVVSNIDVTHSITCFFTQSYERRDPVGGWKRLGARPSAVRTRSEEGAVTLFVPGLDGKVWSAYWPDKPGKWSAWYPIGDNTFPPGAPISAVRTRSEEGAVTLFVPGLDGKVWSAYWPDKPGKWSAWYPIGDNTFPPGAPISAVRTRSEEGAVTLFVPGLDGKVWSAYWPDKPGKWSAWYPIGDNTFPPGAPISAVRTRSEEGAVTLFVPGLDGKVWSAYWPDKPGKWSAWYPIGDNTFPPGAPISAVRTRSEEGA